MNWKTTWVLVTLAGVLFAFIVLVESRIRPAAVSQPAHPQLLALKSGQVTNIVLRRTNQFILQVERTNAAAPWNLTAPLFYPAHNFAIERLLQSLENLGSRTHLSLQEITAGNKTIAEYGLDVPQASLTLLQNGRRIEMLFGARTAVGDHVYMQLFNASGIHVVEATLFDQLPLSVNDWRDTVLVNFQGLQWDRMEVRSPGRGYALAWDATNKLFLLSKPTPARANPSKIEALLRQLHSGRIHQFVSDGLLEELEPLGLKPPETELVLGSGTNELVVVQFGRSPTNDLSLVYARRMSQTNIVLVPRSILEALQVSPNELRDRHLLSLSPAHVDLIEVLGAEKFALRRQPNGLWAILEPEPMNADPELVRGWFDYLGRIEAEVQKDVVTDFTTYGLAPPARQYIFKSSLTNALGQLTNRLVAQLEIGARQEDKIFARRTDEPSVYSISLADFNGLPSAAWQLRDRRVWSFTTNQVSRLTLRQKGGSTKQLVRTGPGDWKIAPGSQGILDSVNSFALEEALYRLGDLRAALWVARGDEQRTRFGFADDGLKITIELKNADKPRLLTLEFGATAPSNYPYALASFDGQNWIFEFPLALFFQTVRDLNLSIPSAQAAAPLR